MLNPVENNCRLVAQKQGIKNCIIKIQRGTQKGDNFLGEISMVTVSDLNSTKQLNLIAKRAIQNPLVSQRYPLTEAYENEIFVYNVVLPALNELQAELDESRKFKAMVQCYYTSMAKGNEMLIMENVQTQGYKMHDKTELLNSEHIEKIFQTYGKFHAISFTLKVKNEKEYSKMKTGLHNMYEIFFAVNNNFCCALKDAAQYIYRRIGKENETAHDIMFSYSENICKICQKLISDETEFSCILHSDCWSNNILFKYKKDDGQQSIEDVCLIDWQLSRVGSPVFDLSYALYSGASKSVLDDFEKYLHIYHESLTSMLTELGCDVEELYPYRILQEHWKKYARFGWCLGMTILKMKFTDEKDILDYTDLKNIDEKKLKDAMINASVDDAKLMPAVRDILDHLISIDAI